MQKTRLMESFYNIYKGGLNITMQSPKGKEQVNKVALKSAYFDDMKKKLAEIKYQIKGVDFR